MRKIVEIEQMKKELIALKRKALTEEDKMYYAGAMIALDWVRDKQGNETCISLEASV